MTQPWQADFYRRPLQDEQGKPLWELVLCNGDRSFAYSAFCPQAEANSTWIAAQLQTCMAQQGKPERVLVFRPQALSLLEAACKSLAIPVQATRQTPALKAWLQEKVSDYRQMPHYTGQPYEPVKLEQPPPLPVPETLWGEKWRFAAIAAADLELLFRNRPMPIVDLPDALLPNALGLASTTPIPGIVMDAGRQSMRLAQWLKQVQPAYLTYIPGEPDGVILDAGLVDRWVLATFDDPEAIAAAKTFRDRQQAAQGLHFLLIQPDDSGVTYTGVWFLRRQSP